MSSLTSFWTLDGNIAYLIKVFSGCSEISLLEVNVRENPSFCYLSFVNAAAKS